MGNYIDVRGLVNSIDFRNRTIKNNVKALGKKEEFVFKEVGIAYSTYKSAIKNRSKGVEEKLLKIENHLGIKRISEESAIEYEMLINKLLLEVYSKSVDLAGMEALLEKYIALDDVLKPILILIKTYAKAMMEIDSVKAVSINDEILDELNSYSGLYLDNHLKTYLVFLNIINTKRTKVFQSLNPRDYNSTIIYKAYMYNSYINRSYTLTLYYSLLIRKHSITDMTIYQSFIANIYYVKCLNIVRNYYEAYEEAKAQIVRLTSLNITNNKIKSEVISGLFISVLGIKKYSIIYNYLNICPYYSYLVIIYSLLARYMEHKDNADVIEIYNKNIDTYTELERKKISLMLDIINNKISIDGIKNNELISDEARRFIIIDTLNVKDDEYDYLYM